MSRFDKATRQIGNDCDHYTRPRSNAEIKPAIRVRIAETNLDWIDYGQFHESPVWLHLRMTP